MLATLQADVYKNSVPIPGKDTGNGQPLFHLQGVERMTIQDVNFTWNNATMVLHFENGYSFRAPIDNVHLGDNRASGILFEGAGPKFDVDNVTLVNFTARRNLLQSLFIDGKTPIGVLAFKGISSKTGDIYTVLIANSTIENNWAREAAKGEVR